MKKIITITLVAATVAATSAFGQGYLILGSGKSAVYDNFTTPGSGALDTKVDAALFYSTTSTATPTVEGLLSGTPTSGSVNFSETTAWNDVINDPNFVEAVDGTAAPGTKTEMVSSTKGIVQYNGAFSFGIQNTTAGSSYAMYEVTWDGALYATLSAAEASGAVNSGNDPIGWSPVLNGAQAVTLSSASAPSPVQPVFGAFGTFNPTAVPEPGTMALAGLGGLSLLAFRRKK